MYRGTYSAPKYLQNHYSYQNANPPLKTKYPEDIQCIIKSADPFKGSLYLSNVQAAENIETVKKLKIGAILTCAKGYMVNHPKDIVPHYKYIAGQDKESFDISLHFEQAVQFIKDTLSKTNIIVHCIAGVSRSVSMVLAYFIKHHDMTYNQAYQTVKQKRRIISPNEGFIKQLKIYQQKIKQKIPLSIQKRSTVQSKDKIGQFYTPKKNYINQQAQTNDKTKTYSQKTWSQFKRQYTYDNFGQNKTPNFKRNDSIQNYERYSKSMSFIPDNQKYLNQQQHKSSNIREKDYSPRKTLFNNYNQKKQKQFSSNGGKSGGYFDAMNKELNEKIQAIRKKYQQQRQEMLKGYSKRGYSSSNLTTLNKTNITSSQLNQGKQYPQNVDRKFEQQYNKNSQYSVDYKKSDLIQAKRYKEFASNAKIDSNNKYKRYGGIYGNMSNKYEYGKQYNKYDTLYQKRDIGDFPSSGHSTQIYRRIYF